MKITWKDWFVWAVLLMLGFGTAEVTLDVGTSDRLIAFGLAYLSGVIATLWTVDKVDEYMKGRG